MFNALYVILGAGLWATDTLFRHPMAHQFSPLVIVFVEHIIATAVTLAWVLFFHRNKIWLGWKQMIGALMIGVFGSALATLLFTMSFQFTNPSIAILLQKVQPILVIFLSVLFLGESFRGRFWFWSTLAIVSAFFVSFPHGLNPVELRENLSNSSELKGVTLALSAAGFWAFSTVAGKLVLHQAPSAVLSFWRFFFGLCTLSVFIYLHVQARIELPFLYSDPDSMKSLFFMATVPVFIGVTLYYRGLAKVPASVATILELSFPLCALWVNSRFLGLHLTTVQLFAAGALMASMIGISSVKK